MNTMSVLAFITIIVVLFVAGVPVYVALGLGSIMFVLFSQGISPQLVIRRFISGVDSTTLLCVPLFILSGDLMAKGGLATRLIAACKLLVGRFRGGLAFVCMIACTVFAAITGTAIACTMALGIILIPEMVKAGYDRDFATGVVTSGSVLGPIIPPSIGLVIYCQYVNGVSLTDLFAASFPAGIFLALIFCVTAYFLCRRRGYQGVSFTKEQLTPKAKRKTLLEGLWALGTPVIILGCVFTGICTPTESAVIAVFYSIIVGMAVFKELKWKDLPGLFVNAGKNTARMMIIIGSAQLFGWVIQYLQLSNTLVNFFEGLSLGKYGSFLLMMLILFILGMFMDATTIVIISTPVFVPIALSLGIDPVHFGICYSVVLGLGLMTPPFGTALYTGSFVGDVPVVKLSKQILPFVGAMIVTILIFVFCPWIFTWAV